MQYKRVLLSVAIAALILTSKGRVAFAANDNPWWQIQSIDTMKYSRDTAGAKIDDPSFDKVIAQQVSAIAGTGANFVAIGTPYDDRFIPFLQRWVTAARKYGLHVWFRGNFSGWEGWFNYPKITRDQHKQLTESFILKHPGLFKNGDMFTACPECENGGPGDPRMNGDLEGHRQFLIDLDHIAKASFAKIGVDVMTDAYSMNADVARLVMDPATTKALGGVVTIDHYVDNPDQVAIDVHDIATKSQGKVILGEFGAPIPDINGNMTEADQAQWIDEALKKLELSPDLIGINYWTSVGGSTALWMDDGTAHTAVAKLQKHFTPAVFAGKIVDEFGNGIGGATVKTNRVTTTSASSGEFHIAYGDGDQNISVFAKGYISQIIPVTQLSQLHQVPMQHESVTFGLELERIWFSILTFFHLHTNPSYN